MTGQLEPGFGTGTIKEERGMRENAFNSGEKNKKERKKAKKRRGEESSKFSPEAEFMNVQFR